MGTPQIALTDSETHQLPVAERQRIAANLKDPATVEGAALLDQGAKAFGTPPVSFSSTAAMSRWFTALSNVRSGAGNAKLLCVGDSTTEGFGATRTTSWPALLTQRLNMFITARRGLSFAPTAVADSTWSKGGWSTVFGPGSGALYADGTQTGPDASFIPDSVVDTIDVWWFQGAGNGVLNLSIDGVAQAAIDTKGGSGIFQKTTFAVPAVDQDGGPAGHVTLKLPVGAPVCILGIDAYQAGKTSVRVANLGVSGSITDTWANGPLSLTGISSYAPDLTIVMLGINDAGNNVSVGTWTSNITAIVKEAQKSGDVLLLSVIPSNGDALAPTYALEQAYRAAAPTLAASLDVPYLDMFGKMGAFSPDRYVDNVHPNNRGYADAARIVAAALRAL